AADIAQRAITLLRDSGNVLPIADRRTLVVQYVPETELRAGRVFAVALRSASPNVRIVKIGPSASPGLLDSLEAMSRESERVVLAAYVRRIEGEGRPSLPVHIADWMNRVAAADSVGPSTRVAMIAFGNPYLIRQVPSVGTYLVTFGVGDALESAAAQAVLGRAAIGGTIPVSLPGFFSRGDGLRRPAP
ncbi:MAG TPA: hypothetical protein VIK50_16720, partial [Gemmatimonadaceae bacterium]